MQQNKNNNTVLLHRRMFTCFLYEAYKQKHMSTPMKQVVIQRYNSIFSK